MKNITLILAYNEFWETHRVEYCVPYEPTEGLGTNNKFRGRRFGLANRITAVPEEIEGWKRVASIVTTDNLFGIMAAKLFLKIVWRIYWLWFRKNAQRYRILYNHEDLSYELDTLSTALPPNALQLFTFWHVDYSRAKLVYERIMALHWEKSLYGDRIIGEDF